MYPPHFLESSTHQDHGPNKIAWNKVIKRASPFQLFPPMGECCDVDPATSLGMTKDKSGRKMDWGPGLFSLEDSNNSYWGKWFPCIWKIEVLA